MADWWSIEVFHGEFRARQWQDAYSSMLIESAVTARATGWEWHEHRRGAVFESEFGEDPRREIFRAGVMARPEPGAGERADLTVTTPPGLPHLAGYTP
jgi:hypothetical protein